MTVAHLVPKKINPKIIEALEYQLERARNGHIESVAIVAIGNAESAFSYVGEGATLIYGLERLKLELLSDE